LDNHIWGYYQNWAGGILLQNASNNVISGNTVYDLCESAIVLQNASNNEISGNIVYDNGGGIRLRGSVTGNMISNNTLNENYIGIELEESTENVISGNTVHDSEYVIHLEESTENVISSNTVNGIRNGYGIWLTDSTGNVISGNTVYDNGRGILLQNASNNVISGNIVYDNSEGIRLYFNNDNEISGNTIMNNYFGIYLTLSNDTMISGNIVHGTEYGISLHDSNENEILGNTVNDTEYGINLVASCDNEITCNLVAYSKETGFRLTAWVGTSTGNTIENNNIIENGVYNEGTGGWEWNIQNEQSVDATAENNYWGTTVSSEIAASILENPGAVDYEPFLSDLSPCAPEPEKPDLVITKKWLCWPDNCTICYNVTNIGTGAAPACHNTTLYVDGVEVAHDHVPVELEHGGSYIGCFDDYTWTYTPPSDNITVCADNNETVAELNETNNCLTNIWSCGDVNCDGKVTMSDVRKVFNRYLGPNYPLDLSWAADVNCDGKVTMSDVRKVFNRYLDPGYELNCCCGGAG
jgi:parallel beta-helix repeat protein